MPLRTALALVASLSLPGCVGSDEVEGVSAQSVTCAVPSTVYDSSLNASWLADLNLGNDSCLASGLWPSMVNWASSAGVSIVPPNKNGTMTYDTARAWVWAMNRVGFGGHNDWQLPATGSEDSTCAATGLGQNTFGPNCRNSGWGKFYHHFAAYPESVLGSALHNTIGPVSNLQPSLYWSVDGVPGKRNTFSFLTGADGRNTTDANYFYVWPVLKHPEVPAGEGVIAYSVDGQDLVYDSITQYAWPANANLAEGMHFGITGTTTVTVAHVGANTEITDLPKFAESGAMLYRVAERWVDAMNDAGYGGSGKWEIPTIQDLTDMFTHLEVGNTYNLRLVNHSLAPNDVQPFFYWACPSADPTTPSKCDESLIPTMDEATGSSGQRMPWSFNLQSGFTGTTKADKEFFVAVYRPGT